MKRLMPMAAALALTAGLAACNQREEPAVATAADDAAALAAPMDKMAGMNVSADAKMASGTGTVTAVGADSVTVDHAPIPQANWPAMTMAFKTSPETEGG
ncbi:MAG: Cu(I)/Ag(I) efflux system protein CusF [Pseudoalteromonas distincta]|jgi:Cu(I)/Ag(I) efflux system protein CusF